MNKWQTQDAFWNSFGIPAYDENVVFTEDEMPSYPHITYQAMSGVMGQTLVVSASVWDRSPSWARISQKADEILKRIAEEGHVIFKIDTGYFWITIPENTPFAQRMASGSDDDEVKRIYITVDAECLTAD